MERTTNTPRSGRLSLWAYLFSCLFLFSATLIYHQWTRTGAAAILTWDATGYYLYLPSLFYDDLGKVNNREYIDHTYQPGPGLNDALVLQPNGNYIMKYSSGMAFMYLPAFAAGHIWAKLGGYGVDGFSLPYQCSVNIWNIIVGLIGLWYLRKLLLKYFEDKSVAVALLVLVMASNYFHYVALCGVLTHDYLFTLYALILYQTDRWYERPTYWRSALLGLVCGLAVLTRPTEIICILIPLLWGITHWKDVKTRFALFVQQFPKLVVFGLAAATMGSVQLIYWKVYSGHWLYYSYGNQSFSWLHPHIINGLFSYRKGWFIYTPVMIFSLIGFIPLYRQAPSLFIALGFFITVNIYISFAWDIWGYGGSFSQRAVVQSYALLMFPLTAFVNVVLKKHWYLVFIPIFIFCTWLNLFMSWQAVNGVMETEAMTRAFFWRTFGRTYVTDKDRKLLDTNEEMPDRLQSSLVPVISYSPGKDSLVITCPVNPDKKVIQLDKEHRQDQVKLPVGNKSTGWFRVYATVYYPEKEWRVWSQTQLLASLYQGNKELKTRLIRVQRITEQGNWQQVYLDLHVPSNSDVDTIAIHPWLADSDKKIWFAGYRIDYTPKE